MDFELSLEQLEAGIRRPRSPRLRAKTRFSFKLTLHAQVSVHNPKDAPNFFPELSARIHLNSSPPRLARGEFRHSEPAEVSGVAPRRHQAAKGDSS